MQVSAALTRALKKNAGAYGWVAATAAAGDLHYYIASSAGGSGGMPAAGSSSSSVPAWVKAHFAAKTIGGQTVYDLTAAA